MRLKAYSHERRSSICPLWARATSGHASQMWTDRVSRSMCPSRRRDQARSRDGDSRPATAADVKPIAEGPCAEVLTATLRKLGMVTTGRESAE